MNSILLRALFLLFIITQLEPASYAQRIKMIQSSYEGDSSYYDITEIAPGRYWMAGEHGLLNEIDSEGNITKVNFPDPSLNILRIQAYQNNVYVGADQGGLYKFNLLTEKWSQALVPKNFDKRCFYDMLLLPAEGKLLLSGGHQKIAKGQKTLPLGFIASIDLEFMEELKLAYKNSFSFIWALEYSAGQVYAASFTGLNTKILTAPSIDLHFKKQSSISGLVHHLEESAGSIYYSGTASTQYAQHGIAGKIGSPQQRLEGYGCIWSIKKVGEQWIALDYAGDILLLDQNLNVSERIEVSNFSLYELETLSNKKAIVIGHGNKVAALDLSKEATAYSVKK